MCRGSVDSSLPFRTHLKCSETKVGSECGRELPSEMVRVQGPSPRSESGEHSPLPAPHLSGGYSPSPLQGWGGHTEGASADGSWGHMHICVGKARSPGVLAVQGIKATDVCLPVPFVFLSMATANSDDEGVIGSVDTGSPRCAQPGGG